MNCRFGEACFVFFSKSLASSSELEFGGDAVHDNRY